MDDYGGLDTMRIKSILNISLLFASALFPGCGKPLALDLNDYEKIDATTKYKVISENDSGFELGVYIKRDYFYTEKRHLVAEAKNEFRKISKMICAKKLKEVGDIDENAFIESVDLGNKAALVRNWVFYKK